MQLPENSVVRGGKSTYSQQELHKFRRYIWDARCDLEGPILAPRRQKIVKLIKLDMSHYNQLDKSTIL